ncbi:DNA utilization protein GntX [bacterium BMS3Abin15]|nr:DNA utilization protein GntX [bacterium BMS3Abin15]HDH07713.1 ComF family protein [Candidatus Moranbacteria bacterium]HDZ85326.1 ComF family protein [Candidatus Moranbacteria bacterium]
MLGKIKKFMLDTLFPVSCISCSKPNIWICKKCLSKIPLINNQVCPFCEKAITPDGRVCFKCRKKYSLDGLLVASSYQNELVSSVVHYYKYRFVEDLSLPLGIILIKAFLQSEFPIPDIIIPVPLHKRRLRWRGFNQAELLAQHLGENLTPGFNISVESNFLTRYLYTHPQMKIKNYAQRKKNIEGVFKPEKGIRKTIKGKNILLVDDIATTGATLFECARVLKRNGANRVFATVIARQEMK